MVTKAGIVFSFANFDLDRLREGLEAGDMGAVAQVKGGIQMKRIDASADHAEGVRGAICATRRGRPAIVLWGKGGQAITVWGDKDGAMGKLDGVQRVLGDGGVERCAVSEDSRYLVVLGDDRRLRWVRRPRPCFASGAPVGRRRPTLPPSARPQPARPPAASSTPPSPSPAAGPSPSLWHFPSLVMMRRDPGHLATDFILLPGSGGGEGEEPVLVVTSVEPRPPAKGVTDFGPATYLKILSMRDFGEKYSLEVSGLGSWIGRVPDQEA